jgi:sulfite reductase alpha subunit
MVLLGCKTEALEPIFSDLTKIDFDLGGSGSDVRTPSCCCGMARCEWACYDTMKACQSITMRFQDELHRPAFPYKWKFKFSGCGNDCVASIARSDLAVIGTWKDEIQIDKAELKKYIEEGKIDIARDVVNNCPSHCMAFDGKGLRIANSDCVKCMHCINVLPKALAPGKERGAAILIGGKAPIIGGALLAFTLFPFVEIGDLEKFSVDQLAAEEGETVFHDLYEVFEEIWDLWGEHGKNRERIGEFIQRMGLGNFLEQIGLDPTPEMVTHPRTNPYIFFDLSEEEE